eukprot:COSAG05_NODE_603_length_8402_cov_7.090931_5_plen_66_part_00
MFDSAMVFANPGLEENNAKGLTPIVKIKLPASVTGREFREALGQAALLDGDTLSLGTNQSAVLVW